MYKSYFSRSRSHTAIEFLISAVVLRKRRIHSSAFFTTLCLHIFVELPTNKAFSALLTAGSAANESCLLWALIWVTFDWLLQTDLWRVENRFQTSTGSMKKSVKPVKVPAVNFDFETEVKLLVKAQNRTTGKTSSHSTSERKLEMCFIHFTGQVSTLHL